MAKKSFSFRLDTDNKAFLDKVSNHGDNRAKLINQALRHFRNSIASAASLSYIFLPGTLFNEYEQNNNKDR